MERKKNQWMKREKALEHTASHPSAMGARWALDFGPFVIFCGRLTISVPLGEHRLPET